MRFVAVYFALAYSIGGSSVTAAETSHPFNGKDLGGWKAKSPDGKFGDWTVGTASLDPTNGHLLKVDAKGDELINGASGHGKSYDLYSDSTYGDATIELEVMVPEGSNSGIYLMGEYEVQVLDSWGHDQNPGAGDMGAIYGAAPPKNPVYKKPGEWSQYKIEYQAPKFDAAGKKTENAKILKVTLNGAVIHENVEMNGPTPGGVDGREKSAGPLMFQGNHGAVSFRNIRVTPAK
jgi:hypothetical protein